MNKTIFTIAILSLFTFSVPAQAEESAPAASTEQAESSDVKLTLDERKKYADWQKQLDDNWYRNKLKEEYDYNVKVELDKNMVTPFMEANTSAQSYCEAVISGLRNMMMSDELAMEAIKENIHTVHCTYEDVDGGEFSLNDGVLTFKSAPDKASGISEETADFLGSAL